MYIHSTITKPRTPLRRMSDKKRSSMEKLAEIRKQKVEKHGRACQIKAPGAAGERKGFTTCAIGGASEAPGTITFLRT
jgi:ribosomal protein S5